MLKRYRTLARYFVHLDPGNPLSEEEIVALIKRRVKRFAPGQLGALQPAA
jgi:hypothetical protein